jgi:hypothetical protein
MVKMRRRGPFGILGGQEPARDSQGRLQPIIDYPYAEVRRHQYVISYQRGRPTPVVTACHDYISHVPSGSELPKHTMCPCG